MNVSPERDGYSLKIEIVETSCIYFCSHFFKAFKDKTRIKNASLLNNHLIKEALCYCLNCKDKSKKYLRNYNTLIDEFFLEGKKLLIQYKVHDKNDLVINITPSGACLKKFANGSFLNFF